MLPLILLLQISAMGSAVSGAVGSSDTVLAVEVHPQLKTEDIVEQLEEGGVRVAEQMELVPLNYTVTGEVLGIPRLEGRIDLWNKVIILRLVETYLPEDEVKARLRGQADATVVKFNRVAFTLGYISLLWKTECNYEENGECVFSYLVYEFLRKYGQLPQAAPPDEYDWASRCDPTHKLCQDWVIKVGYENRNRIALPRTAHYEGHDF